MRNKTYALPGLIGLSAIAWYAVTRLLFEGLRLENWKVGGVPTAYLVMGGILLVTLLIAAARVRSAAPATARRPARRKARTTAKPKRRRI